MELFYEDMGQGEEPIVFISGFAATHQTWGVVGATFAKRHRIIVFDNRGSGMSACPDYPYTVDQMTNDVVGLCQALGISKAYFVGNSMGGCIAQNLAYKFPDLSRGIVLSNTFTVINSRSRLWIESRAALFKVAVPLEALLKGFLPQLYSNSFLEHPGMVEKLMQMMQSEPMLVTEEGYLNQKQALFDFNSTNWLQKILCPCLVINADDDILVSAASGQEMARKIPHAEYYCFRNVGHLPHCEQPDLFVEVVSNFIAKRKEVSSANC